MPGPPDKWNFKAKIDGLTSKDVLDLLNDQASKGNTDVIRIPCLDGTFLFFGNYKG